MRDTDLSRRGIASVNAGGYISDRATAARVVWALAVLVLFPAPADGQPAPSRDRREPRISQSDGPNSRPSRGRAERPARPRTDDDGGGDDETGSREPGSRGGRSRMFGDLPFQPTRADFGPLQPGEDAELLEFARSEVPDAFMRLDRLKRSAPGEFRQKMRDAAPRLRFLRRAFQRNPRLGRVLVEHISATLRINEALRAYRRGGVREGRDRAALGEAIRQRIGARLRIEEQALDLHVTELVDTRDARIAERVDALLSAPAEQTEAQGELQALAERHRAAAEDSEREAIRAQLHERVARRIDAEIEQFRERLANSRENYDARAERIAREMIRRAEQGGDRP